MDAVNNLESIGDVIETDLVGLGHKLEHEGVRISAATQQVLLQIQQATIRSVQAAIRAVSQEDVDEARRVTEMKAEFTALIDSAALHEARRLVAEEPNRIAAYTIEMDIIEKLKRIYYFAKRMAKTVGPRSTAPSRSASAPRCPPPGRSVCLHGPRRRVG